MTPRVLIVEDADLAGRTLVTVLSAAGYEVRLERTGDEALAAAAEWSPDVVLLDRDLPDADGAKLARRLRSEQRRVVVLSGHAAPATVRGVDLWLVKPVSNRELLAALGGDA